MIPTRRRRGPDQSTGSIAGMQRLLPTTGTIPLSPLESTSVVAGSPRSGSEALAALSGLEVGIWEITPGVAVDVEVDEIFIVLSGLGTLEFDDGDVIELRAGAVVRLRAGDRTVWTVRETLRKLYLTCPGAAHNV